MFEVTAVRPSITCQPIRLAAVVLKDTYAGRLTMPASAVTRRYNPLGFAVSSPCQRCTIPTSVGNDQRAKTLGLQQMLSILRRRASLALLVMSLVRTMFAIFGPRTKRYKPAAPLVFDHRRASDQGAGVTVDRGAPSADPTTRRETDPEMQMPSPSGAETAQAGYRGSAGQHADTLDLEQMLSILRRRAWLVVLVTVVAAGATYALSKQQTKQYTAAASLVFDQNRVSEQIAGVTSSPVDPTTQQQTNTQLLTLGPTAAETARALGHGFTAGQVAAAISVNPQAQSNVIQVAATATSPTLAAQIANTYAYRFVRDQTASTQQSFASSQSLVDKQLSALTPGQRQSAQGLDLQTRAQSLALLGQIEAGNVAVAQAAVPPGVPSSPRISRNTLIAAALGLVAGLLLALLLERLDRRIREPSDLERIYGLPLLGAVPKSAAFSRRSAKAGMLPTALPQGYSEKFRLLRAHLQYFNVTRELRSVAIVSAAPGDGKSTIALNLAEAAATAGSKVLLIETDLRRPSLGTQLQADAGAPGLANVLLGGVSIEDAVQRELVDTPSANTTDAPARRSVDVLLAGSPLPPNPEELLQSTVMTDVLARARTEYDLVVVDTPPLGVVPDAFPVMSHVDGVIVVGRLGRGHRSTAMRFSAVLRAAKAPLLGVVANGDKAPKGTGYSYRYSGSYSAPRADKHDRSRNGTAGMRGDGRGDSGDDRAAAVTAAKNQS